MERACNRYTDLYGSLSEPTDDKLLRHFGQHGSLLAARNVTNDKRLNYKELGFNELGNVVGLDLHFR